MYLYDVPEFHYVIAEGTQRRANTGEREGVAAMLSMQEKHPQSIWAPLALLEAAKGQLRLVVVSTDVGPPVRGDYQGAAETLKRLLELYPHSGIGDQALFLLGNVYERSEVDKEDRPDKYRLRGPVRPFEDAVKTYRRLIDTYPGSRFASQSKERIETLEPPLQKQQRTEP
jgi:outer membrane protein assembly factor BamD (BamD/ComL family)